MHNVQQCRWFTVLVILVGCCAGVVSAQPDRQTWSLNGIWDFYPEGKEARSRILVPSFWDAPQDYGYPEEWLHMRHGVYRKVLRVPDSMRGKEIFLSINRVSVIAKVFVNGRQVGALDSGGYLMMQLPYLIDITPHVTFDADNRLEVQVWGGKSMIHGTESQDDLMKADDFPLDTKIEGRFLYPYCVDHWDGRRGLNGDIALVALPKTHISDVVVIPELHKNGHPSDDELMLRVTLMNCDDKSRKVTLSSRVVHAEDGTVSKTFEPMTVVLPAGSMMELVENVSWDNAAYWWPHDPQLYLLDAVLWEGSETVDSSSTRFGFRQFYVSGDHYELNGVRANLRGDAFEFSWHEGYRHGPSTAPVLSTKELIPEMQRRLLHEYRQLNHNMLRPHKASGIDELYDACDEIGMMVFDEAPFWETWVRADERAKPNYEAWIKRWVKERRNHPSIVAWIASNECWYGPTGAILLQAVRSVDMSRPSFNEDPWGPVGDYDIRNPMEGDEDCRHYTGGYPIKVFNTEGLYDVYHTNSTKPTGEGESLFADGFPLMDASGSLTGKRGARGEFGNPDMISQAQWIRGVCRLMRAMRYADISDARLYASWMYAFDPIEADIELAWEDLSAAGIKPAVLHRPIVNVFPDRYPTIRRNPGYEYYCDTFSAVAVFDKEADRQNLIGVEPAILQPRESLRRTLVIYNDEFSGGTEIEIEWTVQSLDPHSNSAATLSRGAFTARVPYGEKREQLITFQLPKECDEGSWLNLLLAASKNGRERFRETNRLGAIGKMPAPRIVVSPRVIELGQVNPSEDPQWHVLRLTNVGGRLSEKWTLAGSDDTLHFNLTSGNCRCEQEIYFQLKRDKLSNGKVQKEIRITGESGTSDVVRISFEM